MYNKYKQSYVDRRILDGIHLVYPQLTDDTGIFLSADSGDRGQSHGGVRLLAALPRNSVHVEGGEENGHVKVLRVGLVFVKVLLVLAETFEQAFSLAVVVVEQIGVVLDVESHDGQVYFAA